MSTILLVLAVTGICSIGLLWLNTSLEYSVWFDDESPSYKQFYGTISSVWPVDFCTDEVILESLPGPSNNQGILAPACLADARKLRDDVIQHLPRAACGLPEGQCEDSFFSMFDSQHIPDSQASTYLSQQSVGSVLSFRLSSVVSGVCCGSNVTSASALKLRFPSLLKDSNETAEFDSWFVDYCLRWRPSAAASASCPNLKHARCMACNSFSDEQIKALVRDVTLLIIAVGVMIIYLAIALGRAANCVESKLLLGSSVVFAVAFSLMIAFGVGTMFNVGFSHMSLLSIFLLLGVGIDDAFIINDAFERSDESLEPAERMAEALFEVGPAVMLTSLTDLLAFIVGATYTIAAIRWFCITAAIAVFAVFLCQVSFFSALVVLNKRREKAGRCDVCPCIPLHGAEESSTEESTSSDEATSMDNEDNTEQSSIRTLVCGRQRRVCHIADMFQLCAVIPVVLCFVALLAFSLYFLATKFTKGVDVSDFISKDSYLVDFWKTDSAHFGFMNPVGIFTTPVDVGDQDQVLLLQKTVHAIGAISSAHRQVTWVDAYIGWYLSNGSAANNSLLLQRFLESPDSLPFRSDLVPDGGNLVTARAWVWVMLAADSDGNLELTRRIRSVYDHILEGQIPGFVWSEFFLSADRYDGIDQTIIGSQLIGLCIVGVVCFLMLPPSAAAASILSIVLVNLDIMGWASLWGVPFSTNMAAILVLSMGFSVDYSAHIAEGISSRALSSGRSTPEDPLNVVSEVLREIGTSVLHGGLSTLLAVLMLSFSKSKGFQDLFKCLLLMVVFGLLHGLVLLPMLFFVYAKLRNKCRRSTDTEDEEDDCCDSQQ